MTHRGLKLNPPEVQEPRAASHGSVGRPLKHDSAELHVQAQLPILTTCQNRAAHCMWRRVMQTFLQANLKTWT